MHSNSKGTHRSSIGNDDEREQTSVAQHPAMAKWRNTRHLQYISPQMKQILFRDNFFQLFSQQSTTLSDTLNFQILYIDDQCVVTAMEISPKVFQPAGLLHGGVSVALAEEVCSFGSALFYRAKFGLAVPVVGVEINANHLAPSTSGLLVAVGSPVHTGRKICVWKCDLYNVCGGRIGSGSGGGSFIGFDQISLQLIRQLKRHSVPSYEEEVLTNSSNSDNKSARLEELEWKHVCTSRCTTAVTRIKAPSHPSSKL